MGQSLLKLTILSIDEGPEDDVRDGNTAVRPVMGHFNFIGAIGTPSRPPFFVLSLYISFGFLVESLQLEFDFQDFL